MPLIREIIFEGNATTRPQTMLREMLVRPGDPADPVLIERSRQGVQDLGLFREVSTREQPLADGVRLVIQVREKYYLLPSPRADYNSDGQYSYGLQLRWQNVWGLNHSLRSTVKYKNRQESGRGTALVFSGGYHAPFMFDSPYSLELSGNYSREPVEQTPAPYEELTSNLRLTLARSFWRENPASESWFTGLGLQWQEQSTEGAGTPTSRGHALAAVLQGGYGWLRSNLYSDFGQSASFELQSASEAWLSDYAYTALTARYNGSWAVGDTPHQSFGAFARAGTYHGTTLNGEPAFELGGVGSLRGYRKQVLRGERYWYGGLEFLRPIGWPWLRGMVFLEAGDVAGGVLAAGGPYADIGLGLRLRLTWFVNLELSAGLAWPLSDAGDSRQARVFAGGYR